MRSVRRRVAAMVVFSTVAATPAACAGADPDPGAASSRVVPALSLTLERGPEPADRELRIRVGMSALADGIDRVDQSRDGDQLGLLVWVRERAPGPAEEVPNSARVESTVVPLGTPFGTARVVDLSTRPPRPVPVVPAS
ncbi:hypothetical protein GCM10022225_38280 [Plantactinospora mayteni]|uniref:Secreted protein n=1 Tax=Plantactinospora mayteni TaxID=566021 RepID=A0ABQ4EWV8_9ACTN|nr:hypothetical protein [Plantactinospora mayteni]GIG99152.1 hypothetical protein Pma05_57250 [Plantactinospora mayteni]